MLSFCGIVHWQFAHLLNEFSIDRENPPQQDDEKQKENHKRNHWPDGNVVDTLKNVLVHIFMC
jgi:hypothetical protein